MSRMGRTVGATGVTFPPSSLPGLFGRGTGGVTYPLSSLPGLFGRGVAAGAAASSLREVAVTFFASRSYETVGTRPSHDSREPVMMHSATHRPALRVMVSPVFLRGSHSMEIASKVMRSMPISWASASATFRASFAVTYHPASSVNTPAPLLREYAVRCFFSHVTTQSARSIGIGRPHAHWPSVPTPSDGATRE